ncbi:MAG: hypothetical protein MR270_01685 [Erysipelotrichaceae bacterium]|nr:hypothetical protein [Erysipelotrichaceae bacterium]
MQILFNLKRPIKVIIQLLAITFFILAISFAYSNELFKGEKSIIEFFKIASYHPVNYSLFNTYDFANTFLQLSNKNSIINQYLTFSSELINAAKVIKVLVIAIMVVGALYMISHIFKYRIYSTASLSVIHLFLVVFFISFTKNQFLETKLIVSTTKYATLFIVFSSLMCFFNLSNAAFSLLMEKHKNKK